ncbi:galactose-3-O-sulfotransferase 2 [Aplochiton taeniatus]
MEEELKTPNDLLAKQLHDTVNEIIETHKDPNRELPGSVVSQLQGALSYTLMKQMDLEQAPLLHRFGQGPDSANTKQRFINTPAPPTSTQAKPRGIYGNVKDSIWGARPGNTCRPKNHIVFLKTHKTASSTILNILYRYGDSRNLTFALPLNMHSQLFYPYFFASHFVEGVRTRAVRDFDIMCNHMRFKKPEVRKVMPQDTFYFSILRNPVAMMESIFIYYKSIPAFRKASSLDDFLDNGWRTYNTSLTNNHYASNILAFDFGFDNSHTTRGDAGNQEARAEAAIRAIESDFQLILISEYFDESMVLLKHALCWSLDDVVSFKLNSRSERTRHTLSPATAEKIRSWNALDWRIYLHFNATFWQRVDAAVGHEEMGLEVALLRERQAQLAKICLKDGGAVDPSQVKDDGLKPFQYGAAVIQGYNLNPGLDGPLKTHCQSLITPELQYTDALYTKKFPALAAKQRLAAKMATSQQHPASNRTAVNGRQGREVWRRRTARGGRRNPNAPHQNEPTSALLIHTAPRNNRNMP